MHGKSVVLTLEFNQTQTMRTSFYYITLSIDKYLEFH